MLNKKVLNVCLLALLSAVSAQSCANDTRDQRQQDLPGDTSGYQLPKLELIKTSEPVVRYGKIGKSNLLFDFGTDAFGQVKLTIEAVNDNDTLTVLVGEMLSADGHINSKPPGTVRFRALPITLKKGVNTYTPIIPSDKRNTGKNAVLMPVEIGEVLPFRYVELRTEPGKYDIRSVSRDVVTIKSDDSASSFTSSDTMLNKIWDLCKHTMKATTFTGYYVDGDRERIPYEADALINQLSHYATYPEYTIAKRTLDYLIYHPTWPTEWMLQNTMIAWYDYLYSGDIRMVAKLYPQLKAKVLEDLAREDGLISTKTGKQSREFLRSIHFREFDLDSKLRDIVDWPQPGETDGFVFSDYNAVVNAFYFGALQSMEKLAIALGDTADAQSYRSKAAKVKQSYIKAFISPETNIVTDGEGITHSSAHANFFALAFGLVPDKNIKPVLDHLHNRGMACSVYGSQFLLDGLFAAGDADYAIKLITSNEKRSWSNMLREGATMTMEAWGQEYKPNQDWGHAWGAAPANVIARHIVGIKPLKPAFEEFEIKPQIGKLQDLRYKHPTSRGAITVKIMHDSTMLQLDAEIPKGTKAQIYLPFNSSKGKVKQNGKAIKTIYQTGYFVIKNITAGKYSFEVQ